MLRQHVRNLSYSKWRASAKPLYAKTLLLPKTLFLPKIPVGSEREKLLEKTGQLLYFWQKDRETYAKEFTLHDGPPYANGDLHLGHALNKILKDVINRHELLFHNLKVNYTPGWDCHGLPIEMKAVKDAGQLGPVETRRRCRELAASMIERQKSQFHQFGIMTDFDHPYETMAHGYEAAQLRVFLKLLENGLLSRQLKPVWWGCETQTALAEAELEYNLKHKSTAIYVKFPLQEAEQLLGGPASLLAWTSTPWTIPANRAICVHRDLEYTVLESPTERLVVASKLAPNVLILDEALRPTSIRIMGGELEGLHYTNPSFDEALKFPVLHGDHVSESAGTGLVHTAPAHGMEDYLVGKKHGLEVESVVDAQGKFIPGALPKGWAAFAGVYANGRGSIARCVEHIREQGMLFHADAAHIHSYPYDWRSKTPVIQRATPQWFVNVERIKDTAARLLDAVEFVPDAGRTRLALFVRNRSEWCILRQRAWGVPLPIVYHKETHEPLTDLVAVRAIVDNLAQLGTDEWFVPEDDVSRWVPAQFHPEHYYKGRDTMDVWFDSGTLWTTLGADVDALMAAEKPLADIYLEGSDQHRGWFQSSLLNKIIASGTGSEFKAVAPFRKIITHGFTLDSKNAKMSKSAGNVVLPQQVVDGGGRPHVAALGPDGLRLWAALCNYTQDVNVTPEVLARVGENIRKLRVTFKYMLGNLANYNEKDMSLEHKFSPLDRWMLLRLARLQRSVGEAYALHNFARVVRELNAHMSSDLSAIYFDVCKDCLYTAGAQLEQRQAIQAALDSLLRAYVGMWAPIQPLLAQEVWDVYGRTPADSPFKVAWEFFAVPESWEDAEVEGEFDTIWAVRDALNKQLEALRARDLFKNKLEAEVFLSASGDAHALLARHAPYLADYFGVSRVTLGEVPNDAEVVFEADCTSGKVRAAISQSGLCKCPRCWKHIAPPDSLCAKCEVVVQEM